MPDKLGDTLAQQLLAPVVCFDELVLTGLWAQGRLGSTLVFAQISHEEIESII